jgi:hypothetical protein
MADETWISFSDLNKPYYTGLMTLFTITTNLISHPFTVISVRQQVDPLTLGEHHYRHNTMMLAVRDAVKKFGPSILLRGWKPMITIGVPSNVIYFSTIEASREAFQPAISSAIPSLSQEGVELLQSAMSSIISNFISLIPYNPAEVISSRLIVQKNECIGMTAMTKQIYREKGIKGFFKGFNASFALYMVSGAQWWFSYSLFRRLGLDTDFGKQNALVVESVAGCISGMSAVAVSYPIDTIKTRIMTNSESGHTPSFTSIFREVVRKDGYRALFRGLPASLYQAALGSTIFAACYELIKSASQNQD